MQESSQSSRVKKLLVAVLSLSIVFQVSATRRESLSADKAMEEMIYGARSILKKIYAETYEVKLDDTTAKFIKKSKMLTREKDVVFDVYEFNIKDTNNGFSNNTFIFYPANATDPENYSMIYENYMSLKVETDILKQLDKVIKKHGIKTEFHGAKAIVDRGKYIEERKLEMNDYNIQIKLNPGKESDYKSIINKVAKDMAYNNIKPKFVAVFQLVNPEEGIMRRVAYNLDTDIWEDNLYSVTAEDKKVNTSDSNKIKGVGNIVSPNR